jgi:hypothetical protein
VWAFQHDHQQHANPWCRCEGESGSVLTAEAESG